MNVLLVNPKSSNVFETFGFIFPPLGLLYVAAASEKAGHRVNIEDFSISDNKPLSFDYSSYDVVGITADTRRSESAMIIAKYAKQHGCVVVMGGPHPGFAVSDILSGGSVDYIVHGEGEISFPALLDALESGIEVGSISGLSYIQDGCIVNTSTGALIHDLDSLPFPARHLVNMELYKNKGLRYGGQRPVAVISSSRGCPYSCSFCITPQMYGERWRARSANSVISEIELLYNEYGYRAFAFCDDNFTVSSERTKEICRLIIEKGLDIWWWCLSSSDNLLNDETMVELMSKAGAKTIYIGIESANADTLDDLNKKTVSTGSASRTVALLKKHGIETFGSYILGGLNDDIRATLKTIALARELDTAVAQFTILTPYPGTELYTLVKEQLRHKKWGLYDGVHLVFRHKNISFFLMQMLLLWAYIRFYCRGLMPVRKFVRAVVNNTSLFRMLLPG